jgi:IS30 family transposase
MQNAKYSRLSEEDREAISRGLAAGLSYAAIARSIGRMTSSVMREVKRNYGKNLYRAWPAERKAHKCMGRRRGGKRKLLAYAGLRQYVEAGLARAWSPDEIARRLKVDYADDMTMRISAEAIYQYIYVLPRGELKATLIKGLRQEHKYRHIRKAVLTKDADKRGKIADMLSIEERPAEVADRTVPGHWEGDLILGKNKRTALGTLVERVTRYTLLVALEAKDAESVRKAYAKALQKLPRTLTRSLTYDQGKEMSGHKAFTIATGITVYFAHPSSPWERGTNENTNGLVRQFFPKGTTFDHLPIGAIRRAQNLLNDRPRKVLNYRTPNEAFTTLVALDS